MIGKAEHLIEGGKSVLSLNFVLHSSNFLFQMHQFLLCFFSPNLHSYVFFSSNHFTLVALRLFIHERQREAKPQAEGEAGSMQGARGRTRFWVSRIMPWAKGDAKPLSHLGCPDFFFFFPSRSTMFIWFGFDNVYSIGCLFCFFPNGVGPLILLQSLFSGNSVLPALIFFFG